MSQNAPSQGMTQVTPREEASSLNTESIERVLGQRYQLSRRLGAGGMGVVFLAHDTITKRTVVVKVLRSDLQAPNDDGSSAARLRREAERLAGVRHPNIVEFFDFGVDEDSPFIVMEYIVGRRLDEFIGEIGVLQTDVFVPIASQILKAVGYAHSLNVVLRDIKPENIMLCRHSGKDLFVKVLDFGLARLVGADGQDRVTRDQLVGTPSCISPEEIQGKELDGRADVYALGVLFYRMLTGVNPFVADSTAALLYKHINEPPPPFASHGLDDIAPALEQLVMRCLEKDPDARPADANAVMEALIDAAPTSMFRLPPAGTYAALHRASSSESLPHGSSIVSRADETPFDSQETSAVMSTTDNRRTMGVGILAIVAILLIGGIGYAFLSAKGDDDAAGSADGQDGGDTLAEIEGLLREGELDAAERLLEKETAKDDVDASLVARAEVLRTKIQLERTLRRAQALELSGDVPGAIEAYLAVLEAEPGNGPAADALRRLRKPAPTADEAGGMLSIDSKPAALLFVDGERVGKTPIETRLALGPHQLRLELGKKTVWKERIDLDEEGVTRSVVLQDNSSASAPVVSTAPRPSTRPRRRHTKPKPAEPAATPSTEPEPRTPEPAEFERVDRPDSDFGKIERRDDFGKIGRPKEDDKKNDGAKLRPF